MSLEEAKQTQSPFHYLTHWLDHRRQYFIERDLAWMRLQRILKAAAPCKAQFGINVDDDHNLSNNLLRLNCI